MAKKKTSLKVEQYTHDDKDRVNIPPVGLVTPDTDKDAGKKTYQFDPILTRSYSGPARQSIHPFKLIQCHFMFMSG